MRPSIFLKNTQNRRYQSPDYIPWLVIPNLEKNRPFEIPVDHLFIKTVFQAFSEDFQKGPLIDNLQDTGTYSLLIEPSLDNINLDMVYFPIDARPPPHQLLDIGGSGGATWRLTREGMADWQKTCRVAIPEDRIPVNPWTGEQIGGMIAEAIASLAGEMAQEMAGDPDKPAVTFDQWLKTLP